MEDGIANLASGQFELAGEKGDVDSCGGWGIAEHAGPETEAEGVVGRGELYGVEDAPQEGSV
jgi:hypothetical protein